MINSYITEGKLVPSEVLVDIVIKTIERKGRDGIFLVDGYPRGMENVEVWNKKMADICDVKFLLYFESSEETMTARLLERGKTSGRSDDNEETIKKRLVTFNTETQPVV
jgi:adenylate kinase family enzyme